MITLEFSWAGLNCLAQGEVENGTFIADSITVVGDLDINELTHQEWDKVYEQIDKSNKKSLNSI